MTKPLADRIALVTGASRGIGYATALALARAGAHVVAVARTVGGLEELDDEIRKIGGSATLVPLDLRDFDGIGRLAAAVNLRYRRLDILIGNAGIGGPSSPLSHVEPKAWDDVMSLNVTANWQLIRYFEPLLRASDAGRAVFISSGAAHNARAYLGPYGVSKAALEMLARTFAAETASTNIRVNLFNPGPTRTRLRTAMMPGEDPMTLPTAEDVAEKIVPMTLPSFTETGKLYDYRLGKLLAFRRPSEKSSDFDSAGNNRDAISS
jgi:NAD(P)-dependent dehydrogenase (short-subunit alcohol dehydrogenase family)